MPWKLRDLVYCTQNKRQGIIMMIKHRKKGRLGDFNTKKSKMYDIRFNDGSILINVEEGSLLEVTEYVERYPSGPSKQYSWVRVGDVILCEKGLGIIRYVGELTGSKNTWMGMELKDDSTGSFSGNKGKKSTAPYFLGTPQDFRDEMKLERDVLESHNGYYKGKKYYDCPRGMGYWLRDKDIHKVYSPEEVLMQLGWLNLRLEELQASKIVNGRANTVKSKMIGSPISAKQTTSAKHSANSGKYGKLSMYKPHNRKPSVLSINYKKSARSRFELMSAFSNEDKRFLNRLKEVVNDKS